jgi:hypothetical protein
MVKAEQNMAVKSLSSSKWMDSGTFCGLACVIVNGFR